MSVKVIRLNDRPLISVKEVMCETEAEIFDLPAEQYPIGSIAYTPGMTVIYHMCMDGMWHLIGGGGEMSDEERQALLNRIAEMQQQITEYSGTISTLRTELETAEQNNAQLEARIATLETESLADKARIAELEAENDNLREMLEAAMEGCDDVWNTLLNDIIEGEEVRY